MTSTERLLSIYHNSDVDESRRAHVTMELMKRARTDEHALMAILTILNSENDSSLRLAIIEFLDEVLHPLTIRALTKQMFDPDPLIRGRAALALAKFKNHHLLSPSLDALLNAVTDPATRSPAEQAIRFIAGRSPEKITSSERERIRLGESAESLWPEYYAKLRSSHGDDERNLT